MTGTLYCFDISANSHTAMILCDEAKLDVTVKPLDFMKGEHKTPEMLEKNPLHVMPTYEDANGVIWESNAIARYLANANKLDQWYPQEDVYARAKCDQALDWRQCSLYKNIALCCYPPLFGFQFTKEQQKQGLEGATTDLGMLASIYLKEGKFINGAAKPTIADLSIRPALEYLRVLDFEFAPEIVDYMARFDAAVPSFPAKYGPALAGLVGYAKSQAAAKAAEAAAKKEAAKKAKKDKKAAKVVPEPAPTTADGLDSKRVKAAIKEGGKKGQDLAGMSAFGVHFFCTSFDEPKGEMEYLELCMQGANIKVDEEAEERKGGAGDLGKIFFSAGDNNLAMICHVPQECKDKVDMKEWFEAVLGSIKATINGDCDEHFMRANVAADPDNDRFPLKMRDVAISAGFAYLKQKGLVLDDDSDDDINFADDCGVDLNAGATGDY